MKVVAISSAALLAVLAGCSEQSADPAPTVTVTETVTASPEASASASPTAAPSSTYPSGASVVAGYPVLVDTALLDYRVANAIKTTQAVAVAPGVYSAYVPTQPDLQAYLTLPNEGDCAVRELYFPRTGGACWSGVLPGPQEPPPSSP